MDAKQQVLTRFPPARNALCHFKARWFQAEADLPRRERFVGGAGPEPAFQRIRKKELAGRATGEQHANADRRAYCGNQADRTWKSHMRIACHRPKQTHARDNCSLRNVISRQNRTGWRLDTAHFSGSARTERTLSINSVRSNGFRRTVIDLIHSSDSFPVP